MQPVPDQPDKNALGEVGRPQLLPVNPPPVPSEAVEVNPAPKPIQTQMKPLGFLALLQRELEHVAANRRVVVLLVGMTLLPALFLLIQVASAWDPYGSLQKLPVGLVVLDQGTTYVNKNINIGSEVQKTLLDKKTFDFKIYSSAEEVRSAVDRGEVYFAAMVPADFSQKAIQGQGANPSNLTLITAEGTSYFSNRLGKTFATNVSDTIKQTLEEERWGAVLSNIGSAQDGLGQLKQGAGQLRDGAKKLLDGSTKLQNGVQSLSSGLQTASVGSAQLADGAKSLNTGVTALTGGVSQLGGGIRSMSAKLPSDDQLNQLSSGADQLKTGSVELASGLDKLSIGGNQLAQDSANLKAGVDQLSDGGATLSEKSGELLAGTSKLESVNFGGPNSPLSQGIHQIHQGALGLNQGAQSLAQGIAKADAGVTELDTGATQLALSSAKAAVGSRKLATGAQALSSGVNALSSGVKQLSAGVATLQSKLPAQADLDKLSNGANTLASKSSELSAGLNRLNDGGKQLTTGSSDLRLGAQQLANGLNLLYEEIPASSSALSGDAQGLANSVRVDNQNLHPVANNGLATAPLFAGFALWMGVLILAMMFNFNHLPEQAKGENQISKVLVKLATPALISAIQAIFSGLLIVYMMQQSGYKLAHPLAFFAVLLWASQAFMAVVSAIMMLMGGAGRAVVSLLLILQFVSAGGNFPIELSPPFFQAIHPWLPVTHLLEAMRATMFGSYAGNWQSQTLILIAFTIGGLAVCVLAGRRWRYVKNEEYKLEPVLLS